VACWGDNRRGQLGFSSTALSSSTPVSVLGLSNIISIDGGFEHTCAVAVGGNVFCWGLNNFGQLGNSTTQNRSFFDTVSGLTDALAVTAGAHHTCAVRALGTALCWGRNVDGELAAKDSAEYHVPTPVIQLFKTVQNVSIPFQLQNVVGIFANSNTTVFTCALLSSGQPKCWGRNEANQVGDGSRVNRPRPTTVPSFTANIKPTAKLRSNGRIIEITVLVNCEPDAHAHISVAFTQGTTTGNGHAVEACTGGLMEVDMHVSANGAFGFKPGVVTAELEASIRDHGTVIEDEHWTRQVTVE